MTVLKMKQYERVKAVFYNIVRLHLRNKPTFCETENASECKCNSEVSLGSRVTPGNFSEEQFGIGTPLTKPRMLEDPKYALAGQT